MGLLDFDKNYKPPYRPPKYKGKPEVEEEENLGELNNLGRKKVSKDFSDSPFLEK